ncbi:MAG: hypothetical protein RR068_07710 [Hafnia sp.]
MSTVKTLLNVFRRNLHTLWNAVFIALLLAQQEVKNGMEYIDGACGVADFKSV